MLVSADEPAGKPIKDCRLVPVNLTLYRRTDRKIKANLGIPALREYLAAKLSEEAHHQGGLLSQADLAEILIVDESTVKGIVKRTKARGGSIPKTILPKIQPELLPIHLHQRIDISEISRGSKFFEKEV